MLLNILIIKQYYGFIENISVKLLPTMFNRGKGGLTIMLFKTDWKTVDSKRVKLLFCSPMKE